MADSTNPNVPRRGLVVALTMVFLAVVAVVAAVGFAGGLGPVAEMLGIAPAESTVSESSGSESQDPEPGTSSDGSAEETSTDSSLEPTSLPEPVVVPGASGSSAQSASSASAASGTFPVSAAQAAMYREQLQSQGQLLKLVNGEISSVAIGNATTSATSSSIPLTVLYKSGSSLSGTMVLTRTDGLWYFSSISAGGGASTPKPREVDSSVVSVIVSQQATAANQQLMQDGLVDHGFVTARVDGVAMGSGTATVNVTLLGGALDRRAARFVMISKTDSGNKYWFVTRFELK